MIERLGEMPAGTIGLRASGRLTLEDYRQVLEPALQEAIASGELRLLFLVSDFAGLEGGAWIEDVKTGLNAWVRHHSAWKRFALVTDVEWIAKATRMFTWLIPGEAMICHEDGLEQARTWVAS